MLKKELERLYKIGLLYKCSISIWIAPTVLIPKKKGMVRFLSDFRYLNKCLFRRPYLIPKIAGVLQNFGEICDATSLDLNMGCYTVQLDPYSQKLCTIIMQWGKYQDSQLSIGLYVPLIFQEKSSNLIISKSTFKDHLCQLQVVIPRLRRAGLKVNTEKSSFLTHENGYI